MIIRKTWIVVAVIGLLFQTAFAQPPSKGPAKSADGHTVLNSSPIELGTRRELFVDRHLIESLTDSHLQLQRPQPAEIAIKFDKAWEGPFAGYVTVIKDRDVYRMYYRGLPTAGQDGTATEVTCYAVSRDGITWKKPNLGIFEWGGSKENNIVLMGQAPASHNFAPFLDLNPDAALDQRYKALGGIQTSGLIAFASADGVHWNRLQDKSVFRKGIFDSQNVSFWSTSEQKYLCYFRTWTAGQYAGFRTVSRATSDDFLNWTDPEPMKFGETPPEHLYTNQTTPYFRAPHIYLGLAARFMPGRKVISPGEAAQIGVVKRYSNDCSDSVLISSRGGDRYDRTFMESFLRPGIGIQNWVSRSNYAARGIVPTGNSEISIYLSRNYGQATSNMQRYTLRTDGFASVSAGYSGGEMLTRLINFPQTTPDELVAKRENRVRQIKNKDSLPEVFSERSLIGKHSLKINMPLWLDLPGTKSLSNEFTLAAHVASVPSSHRRLFSAYNGGSTAPNEMILDFNSGGNIPNSGSIRFKWNDFELTANVSATGNWSAEAGDHKPHHIALTWKAGLAKIYFDGALVGEKQMADAKPVELALGNLRFGEDYPPTSLTNEPFLGIVDDILVLNRALDSDFVAKLVSAGLESVVDRESDKGIALTFENEAGQNEDEFQISFDNLIGDPVCYPPFRDAAARQLSINMSTSAAGSIRVEIQNESGHPIPGFSAMACDEIVGDQIDRIVTWRGKSDVSSLADRPLRLRFVLKDADLFSLQFK